MRFLTSVGIVLMAICGLASAGLQHHGHHQHYHQHDGHHGSSYAVISKHEEPAVKHELSHKAWEEHGHGHELIHHIQHKSDEHEDYEAGHGHENSHDYYAAPKYEYDYAVKDEKTGDSKKHWETRDGDKVKGSYTIKDADGTTRTVEYTADHKNGFNAVVKTEGHAHSEHESYSSGGQHASHGYAHYSH